MIGETVGSYTIVSELGRGGMGVVYLANHRHLPRKAAIKILLREFTDRSELVERFFTEARATSLLDHDGIVRVLDCDIHPSGHAYLVMEYLEGETLRTYLAARGRIPFPQAAAIVIRVADALAAAHAKQIVHRDLKPDNIFVMSNPVGGIKIVDFGIAKLANPTGSSSRTQSGMVLGTPLYMSPEQARGHGPVDARTDIYSLGCMLFEMLSGRPPFLHAGAGELIAAHLGETPPSIETLEPSVPIGLARIINSMLAKSPDDRPASVKELIAVLQSFSTGRGVGRQTAVAPSVTPSETVAFNPAPAPRSAPAPRYTPSPESHDSTFRPVSPQAEATHRHWASRRPLMILGVAGVAAIIALVAWRPWDERKTSTGSVPLSTSVQQAPLPPAVAPPPETAPPPVLPRKVEAPQPEPPAEDHPRAVPTAAPEASAPRRTSRPTAPQSADPTIAVSVVTEPAGAEVCLADNRTRLGVTNGTFRLRSSRRGKTLLLYLAGHHLEKITITAAADTRRSIKLRRLADDDLQEPPPCR
jgi:serine/threonine protein kinase